MPVYSPGPFGARPIEALYVPHIRQTRVRKATLTTFLSPRLKIYCVIIIFIENKTGQSLHLRQMDLKFSNRKSTVIHVSGGSG